MEVCYQDPVQNPHCFRLFNQLFYDRISDTLLRVSSELSVICFFLHRAFDLKVFYIEKLKTLSVVIESLQHLVSYKQFYLIYVVEQYHYKAVSKASLGLPSRSNLFKKFSLIHTGRCTVCSRLSTRCVIPNN